MKNYLFTLSVVFLLLFGFSVFKVSAEETYYDFSVEQIYVSPPNPMLGQDCKIRVLLKNKGTKNIYSSDGFLNYEYNFGDFSLSSLISPNPTTQSPIYPSDTFEYYYEGKFLNAGSKTLSFDFRFYEYYYEKNEDNNFKTKSISVGNADGIDLSVTEIEIDDYEDGIIAGDDLKITVTVKNTGKVSLTDGRGIMGDNVKLDSSGFQVSSYQLPGQPDIDNSFDPNEELEYIYYGEFDRLGDQKMIFYVDYENAVAELSENNNFFTITNYIYLNQDERDDFEIYDIDYNLISTSSASIVWKTTKTATSKLGYHAKYYSAEFVINKDRVDSLDHEILIENLTPGENYLYRVESTNNDVDKISNYYEFITPIEDKVSVISEPSVNFLSTQNPKISWSTDVISQGYVYYKLNTGSTFKKKGSSSLVDEHVVDLGNLSFGVYQYYVISTSTKMNLAYISSVKTFEIKDEAIVEESGNEESQQSQQEIIINEETEIENEIGITNTNLYQNLKGKIILKVEQNGEAYYVHPDDKKMYYLGRPDDAFRIMRELGLGISENDYNDFYNNNNIAPTRLSGKIILRVEAYGEAYYINPIDKKMHYLGRPADAFGVMRELGLGISNDNFASLYYSKKIALF